MLDKHEFIEDMVDYLLSIDEDMIYGEAELLAKEAWTRLQEEMED